MSLVHVLRELERAFSQRMRGLGFEQAGPHLFERKAALGEQFVCVMRTLYPQNGQTFFSGVSGIYCHEVDQLRALIAEQRGDEGFFFGTATAAISYDDAAGVEPGETGVLVSSGDDPANIADAMIEQVRRYALPYLDGLQTAEGVLRTLSPKRDIPELTTFQAESALALAFLLGRKKECDEILQGYTERLQAEDFMEDVVEQFRRFGSVLEQQWPRRTEVVALVEKRSAEAREQRRAELDAGSTETRSWADGLVGFLKPTLTQLGNMLAKLREHGIRKCKGVTNKELLELTDGGSAEDYVPVLWALASWDYVDPPHPLSKDVWLLDYECIEDHGDYGRVFERLAALAGRDLPLKRIKDHVDVVAARAFVEFELDGKEYHWDATVDDDWLDLTMLARLVKLLSARRTDRRFAALDCGQFKIMACLNSRQRIALRKELGVAFEWV